MKETEDIIDEITEIRRVNNLQWMKLVKICFESNPTEAKKIFKNITDNDKKINELSRELCE
jgi:hypothetical protein